MCLCGMNEFMISEIIKYKLELVFSIVRITKYPNMCLDYNKFKYIFE